MANIKFKYPPITELVIGLYFDRDIPTFKTEHIGLFWSTIRSDFPTVRQQPIIVPPIVGHSQQVIFDIEDVPMQRFWFEAVDGATLIQIQRNAFLINWRKRDEAYPHYESVKAAFDRYFELFSVFLAKEAGVADLKVRVAELTYINSILPNEYWRGLADTRSVLPLFSLPVPTTEEEVTADFNQATTRKIASDLTLNTTVRSARATRDPNIPALVFELRALGLLNDSTKSEADKWFIRSHDAIGECFLAMTNAEVQDKYWQRITT